MNVENGQGWGHDLFTGPMSRLIGPERGIEWSKERESDRQILFIEK